MVAMSLVTLGTLLWIQLMLGACTSSDLASSSKYGELASLHQDPNSACPFSPIQITILSSNGTDLSSSIPTLHSHSHTPLSTLQRRSSTSVPIRECPLGDTYIPHSWCQHEVSPQDFELFCDRAPQEGRTNPQQLTHIRKGKCARDEICVGSNRGDMGMSRQAYCVSTNHFVHIGHTPSSGNEQNIASSGVVTAAFNSALYNKNGSYLAVEAVVTNVNNTTSVFADSVVMQAQAYNGLWRTVAGGHNYCLKCSSVRLAPFPVTAQRVKVDVVMPEWIPTGLLWLASYSY